MSRAVRVSAAEPAEFWGCQTDFGRPCSDCTKRWGERQSFIQKAVAHITLKCPNVPPEEVYPSAVAVANCADALDDEYDDVNLDRCNFYSMAQVKEHQEIVSGVPRNAVRH